MVEPPKKIKKETEYLNSRQLNKLLNCVDNIYYKRLFEFTARTSKNSLIRNVPLSNKAKKILEEIEKEQNKMKALLEDKYNKNDEYNKNNLVFTNDDGGPKDPSTVYSCI